MLIKVLLLFVYLFVFLGGWGLLGFFCCCWGFFRGEICCLLLFVFVLIFVFVLSLFFGGRWCNQIIIVKLNSIHVLHHK